MRNEEWFDVKQALPEIGQRVRVLVVKEMIYEGIADDGGYVWRYDQEGEHGIYSWNPCLKKDESTKW